MREPRLRGLDQIRHKPACTAKEDNLLLDLSDLDTIEIIQSGQRTTNESMASRGNVDILLIYKLYYILYKIPN